MIQSCNCNHYNCNHSRLETWYAGNLICPPISSTKWNTLYQAWFNLHDAGKVAGAEAALATEEEANQKLKAQLGLRVKVKKNAVLFEVYQILSSVMLDQQLDRVLLTLLTVAWLNVCEILWCLLSDDAILDILFASDFIGPYLVDKLMFNTTVSYYVICVHANVYFITMFSCISYDLISSHPTWDNILPRNAIQHHTMSFHITSYHVMSCNIIDHIISFL